MTQLAQNVDYFGPPFFAALRLCLIQTGQVFPSILKCARAISNRMLISLNPSWSILLGRD